MVFPTEESASTDPVPPSQSIIETVAAHEGVDVTEIEPPEYEPLYSVVNPEALDRLFRPVAYRDADPPPALCGAVTGRLVIEYEGYEIIVYSNGRVGMADDADSASETIGE